MMYKCVLLHVLALNILNALGVEVTLNGRQYFSYSLKDDPIPTDKNQITLRFKTIHPSGLLVYSRGTSDYIQVELINGALKYTLYLGGEEKTEIQAGKNLFNGEWHTVSIRRRRRQTTLKVDSQSPKTKILPGPYDRLNLNSYIFVGGMIDASKKNLGIRAQHYRGCIADLHFDGIRLLEGAKKAKENLPRTTPYEIYGDIPFKCKLEDYRPVSFMTPQSYVKVSLPKLPQDNDTFSASFKFRTFYPHGLLFSRSAIKVKMNVRLHSGVLLYDVTAPNGTKAHIRIGKGLNDGEWHDVNASIFPPKVSVSLDGYSRSRILNMTSLLLDFSNKSRMKIFAGRGGSLSKFPGFVGCMLNLRVDSHKITNKFMRKQRYSHGVDTSKCSTKNRCFPIPCHNRGICSQDWKEFYCDCSTTYFEGKRCETPIFKSTCEDYKELGLKMDAHCLLHTGRNKAKDRYTALCNVTDPQRSYTVVKHNLETGSTRVKDGDFTNGQYVHKIHYHNLEEQQIGALIQRSKKCRQFIRFDCLKTKLTNSPDGPSHVFWSSRDKTKRYDYWGGATESGKCACGMSKPSKCANSARYCNCDIKDNRWRVDEGYLEQKDRLPVMVIMFNKNAGKTESNFRLGPLECWGKSDKKEAKTSVKDLIQTACYPVVEPSTAPTTVSDVTTTPIPPTPCPEGLVCNNSLIFPTDTPWNIWTNPRTTVSLTTKESKDFNVQQQETSDDSGLGTPAIVLIACALIIILLLAIKFALPSIIAFVRTHSKRGEYIVPPPGPGYPARLMPLVTKRSSQRGRQLTIGETTHLPTEQNNGSAVGGVNSYWV